VAQTSACESFRQSQTEVCATRESYLATQSDAVRAVTSSCLRGVGTIRANGWIKALFIPPADAGGTDCKC